MNIMMKFLVYVEVLQECSYCLLTYLEQGSANWVDMLPTVFSREWKDKLPVMDNISTAVKGYCNLVRECLNVEPLERPTAQELLEKIQVISGGEIQYIIFFYIYLDISLI